MQHDCTVDGSPSFSRPAHLVKNAAKAKGVKVDNRKSDAEIDELNEGIAGFVDQRVEMSTHEKAGELRDGENLQALGENEKLLLDMIRCRADTRLAMIVLENWKDTCARGIATRLFLSAADIIPEHDKGILRVRILGSARDSNDIVAAELLEELDSWNAFYSGTNPRPANELPQYRAKRANPGSKTIH